MQQARIWMMAGACALGLAACEPEAILPGRKALAPAAVSITTAPMPVSVTPVMFSCGGTLAKAIYLDDTAMTLEVGGTVHRLGRVVVASGAQYATPAGVSPTVTFWNQGEAATLALNGAALPECGVASMTAPATPVVGTTWQVRDLNGTPPVGGRPLTVAFGNDGRISGDAGCNRFSGSYTLSGEALEIGPMISTRMACADPAMNEQENRMLGLLNGMTQLGNMGNGRLTLRDANGKQMLLVVAP